MYAVKTIKFFYALNGALVLMLNVFTMNKISKQETPEKITLLISTSAYHESVSASIKAFLLAEKLNHHPTVTTGYNQVKVEISTHDAGSKVTDKDREYIRLLMEQVGK